jgi:hypothetical protein
MLELYTERAQLKDGQVCTRRTFIALNEDTPHEQTLRQFCERTAAWALAAPSAIEVVKHSD